MSKANEWAVKQAVRSGASQALFVVAFVLMVGSFITSVVLDRPILLVSSSIVSAVLGLVGALMRVRKDTPRCRFAHLSVEGKLVIRSPLSPEEATELAHWILETVEG